MPLSVSPNAPGVPVQTRNVRTSWLLLYTVAVCEDLSTTIRIVAFSCLVSNGVTSNSAVISPPLPASSASSTFAAVVSVFFTATPSTPSTRVSSTFPASSMISVWSTFSWLSCLGSSAAR